jgi:hypothetical protein
MIRDLPQYAENMTNALANAVDGCLDAATRVRGVSATIFNTVTAVVLLCLSFEIPLQRVSVLLRSYFFCSDDGKALRKTDAVAVQKLIQRLVDSPALRDKALVSEFTRLGAQTGIKVIMPKCVVTRQTLVTRPFFPVSDRLAQLLALYRIFCLRFENVSTEIVAERAEGAVRMFPLLQTVHPHPSRPHARRTLPRPR